MNPRNIEEELAKQSIENTEALDEFCEICLKNKYYDSMHKTLENAKPVYKNYNHYKERLIAEMENITGLHHNQSV